MYNNWTTFLKSVIINLYLFNFVMGETIIVDQSGNGDYLTIQEGIDSAVAGDTVKVSAGMYNGAISINKDLVLLGVDADSTTITCDSCIMPYYQSVVSLSYIQRSVLKGFTIVGSSHTSNGISCSPGLGLEIVDNIIKGQNNGILVKDSPFWGGGNYTCADSCYLKIYGNVIKDNKVGIYLDGGFFTGSGYNDTITYNATGNWWGVAEADSVINGIFDWSPRIVDYSDWLLDSIERPVSKQPDGIHRNDIFDNSEWNIFVGYDQGIFNKDKKDTRDPYSFRIVSNMSNRSYTIFFNLKASNFIKLEVCDLSGRTVSSLVSGIRDMGSHQLSWNGKQHNLATGIYIIKLQIKKNIYQKKVMYRG